MATSGNKRSSLPPPPAVAPTHGAIRDSGGGQGNRERQKHKLFPFWRLGARMRPRFNLDHTPPPLEHVGIHLEPHQPSHIGKLRRSNLWVPALGLRALVGICAPQSEMCIKQCDWVVTGHCMRCAHEPPVPQMKMGFGSNLFGTMKMATMLVTLTVLSHGTYRTDLSTFEVTGGSGE